MEFKQDTHCVSLLLYSCLKTKFELHYMVCTLGWGTKGTRGLSQWRHFFWLVFFAGEKNEEMVFQFKYAFYWFDFLVNFNGGCTEFSGQSSGSDLDICTYIWRFRNAIWQKGLWMALIAFSPSCPLRFIADQWKAIKKITLSVLRACPVECLPREISVELISLGRSLFLRGSSGRCCWGLPP